MRDLETEVKFFIPNMAMIRELIPGIGGIFRGNVFEINVVLDDANASLFKSGALLRIRQNQRKNESSTSPSRQPTTNILTYKSAPLEAEEQYKVCRELEVEIGDFDTACNIFGQLGFCRVRRYEKQRETVDCDGTIICLDTLPFGDFLEIEGDKENILCISRKLGLKWEKRILVNYLALFERLRSFLGFSFTDITFDNFKTIDTADIRAAALKAFS